MRSWFSPENLYNLYRNDLNKEPYKYWNNNVKRLNRLIHKFTKIVRKLNKLEALPVDDRGAGLVVFLFADPHLLEGG